MRNCRRRAGRCGSFVYIQMCMRLSRCRSRMRSRRLYGALSDVTRRFDVRRGGSRDG